MLCSVRADASVQCRKPLDEWLSECASSGFFAFADPGPDRRCATWFLASVPDGAIVSELAESLASYLQQSGSSGRAAFSGRRFVGWSPW